MMMRQYLMIRFDDMYDNDMTGDMMTTIVFDYCIRPWHVGLDWPTARSVFSRGDVLSTSPLRRAFAWSPTAPCQHGGPLPPVWHRGSERCCASETHGVRFAWQRSRAPPQTSSRAGWRALLAGHWFRKPRRAVATVAGGCGLHQAKAREQRAGRAMADSRSGPCYALQRT